MNQIQFLSIGLIILLITLNCSNLTNSIPKEYFNGIKRIDFIDLHKDKGFYFIGGIIQIYNGCDRYILIHELAHHNSKQKLKHNKEFYKMEKNIEVQIENNKANNPGIFRQG